MHELIEMSTKDRKIELLYQKLIEYTNYENILKNNHSY